MKKLILAVIIGIFVILLAGAGIFLLASKNVGTYNEEERKMVIKESVFDNAILAEVKLISPDVLFVIRGKDRLVAEFEITNLEKDYSEVFTDMDFYNIKKDTSKFEREFTYKYKEFYNVSVNDYETVCKEREVWINQTNVIENYDCYEDLIGSHIEERFNWIILDEAKKELPTEKIIIGVFTDVLPKEHIEWIPTLYGVRVNEWAEWTESLNVDLVAYWDFDVDGDDTTGNGISCTGDAVHDNANGIIGGYYDYTGAVKLVCSQYAPLNMTGEVMSMSAWIRSDGDGAGGIVTMPKSATIAKYGFYEHATQYEAGIDTTSGHTGIQSTTDGTFNTGVWQHWVQTYDGSDFRWYVNGSEYKTVGETGAISASGGSNALTLGVWLSLDTYYNGGIDELGIWNRTLSPTEVTQLWNEGAGIQYIDPPPAVTLNIPANNTGFAIGDVEFNCSATDNSALNNITLYIDGVKSTSINATGTYGELNITLNFGEGTYIWACSATDDIDQLGWSAPNRTFSIDTIDPVVNIVYPIVNNSNWTIDTLDVNFTRSDANLADCWYSNDTYEVNKTLTNCGNVTDVVWSQGNHNVTIWVNDTAGHEVSDGISFTIDSINPDINITYPINNTNWTINTVDVNYTTSDLNLAYCWYSNDTYEVNKTLANCGNLTNIIWSDGNHNVSIWSNDTFGNENASRISFTIDTIVPEVNITYPLTHVNYQEINTNLTINYSASDSHLASCWGSFDNGVNNISLVCADQNISRNITSVNNNTFSFWANDTLGNEGTMTRTWIYKIFEVQQTYSSITIPGSTETFVNNIFLGSGETITELNFNYNGTDKSAGYSSLGGGEYNLSSTFVIPSVAAATNITFFWKINLLSGQINTSSNNQSIRNIAIDDCSGFSVLIFNYTIIDEESQTKLTINTSLELDIDIFDAAGTTLILNFSKEYIDTNPATVCLNINLTEGADYSLDSTAKYSAANHSIEYYNIQNFLLKNATIPQHINLFDLHVDDTTGFQITFKDSNFVTVENALIQINRQYVSEGLFKTVEIPKTDSNGQTVAHLVEEDVVYNIIVLKQGVVLGTFNNIIAFCEDNIIGSCFISLNSLKAGEVPFDYDEEIGLFYSFDYNETSRNLQFDFTTTDGSVKTVNLSAIKFDQLGDTAVCDGFLTSSSGSIFCHVPESVGNETIIVSIFVEGDLKITNYIRAGRELDIGDVGYFLMFFLVLSLALMMTQSKTGVIIGVILGFIAGVLLSFIQGGLLGIGSSVIWLVVMGIILIYKMSTQGQT